VFESKALRRIYGPRREEAWKSGEDCIIRSFRT
jgi:hypothetical protein